MTAGVNCFSFGILRTVESRGMHGARTAHCRQTPRSPHTIPMQATKHQYKHLEHCLVGVRSTILGNDMVLRNLAGKGAGKNSFWGRGAGAVQAHFPDPHPPSKEIPGLRPLPSHRQGPPGVWIGEGQDHNSTLSQTARFIS